jgi:hypothetical protein
MHSLLPNGPRTKGEKCLIILRLLSKIISPKNAENIFPLMDANSDPNFFSAGLKQEEYHSEKCLSYPDT